MNHLASAAIFAALLLISSDPAGAAFSCDTVVKSGDPSPGPFPFGPRIRPELAINDSGDTLLVARPLAARDTLYMFPAGGAPEAVATGDGPAPGGLTFKSSKAFTELSINNGGDIAFRGRMFDRKRVLFHRPAGGSLESLVSTGEESPAGGRIREFIRITRLTEGGRIAFLAAVKDGPSGAFVYDVNDESLTPVALVGDTLAGRELCTVRNVGLGDLGTVVIHAETRVDCDAGNRTFETILSPSAIIAMEGDASPIAGTIYQGFVGEPKIDEAGNIGFMAEISGAKNRKAMVIRSPAGALVVSLAELDPTPDIEGVFHSFHDFHLTEAGSFVNARLKGTGKITKAGVLSPTAAAILDSDPPPSDAFGPMAKYKSFPRRHAMSRNGHLAILARVKDEGDKSRAVIRCAP